MQQNIEKFYIDHDHVNTYFYIPTCCIMYIPLFSRVVANERKGGTMFSLLPPFDVVFVTTSIL